MVPCRGDRENTAQHRQYDGHTELDGEPIITASFADLKNPWMEINTPFMIVNVARPEIRRP